MLKTTRYISHYSFIKFVTSYIKQPIRTCYRVSAIKMVDKSLLNFTMKTKFSLSRNPCSTYDLYINYDVLLKPNNLKFHVLYGVRKIFYGLKIKKFTNVSSTWHQNLLLKGISLFTTFLVTSILFYKQNNCCFFLTNNFFVRIPWKFVALLGP